MFLSSHWKMNFVAKSSQVERETVQAWKVPQSLLSSSVYHSHETKQQVYKYGCIHRCRWPGPPVALLIAEWASYQCLGYATEPPQGSLGLRQASGYSHFSQAWQWTYLVFGFWSREAWISLLPLMKGIGQSVLSVQLVNFGGNFGFGIKGCINNSEQKHHRCVWPRPLHHSCPLHDYKLASSVL